MTNGPCSANPHPYGTTAWLVEERKQYASRIDELHRRAERAEAEREAARDDVAELRAELETVTRERDEAVERRDFWKQETQEARAAYLGVVGASGGRARS